MGDIDEVSPSDSTSRMGEGPSLQLGARARATQIAMEEASTFLIHARFCFGGLVILLAVRCVAWLEGYQPRSSVVLIHALSICADLISTCIAVPFVVLEQCNWFLRQELFGVLMSVIFAMIILDLGALLMVVYTLSPQPLASHVPSLFDVVHASFGAWESIVVASVALQFTLCVCAFRTYREFRVAGAYPPHTKPPTEGEVRTVTVSPLEVVCETENVELLAEHELHIVESIGMNEYLMSEGSVKLPLNAD